MRCETIWLDRALTIGRKPVSRGEAPGVSDARSEVRMRKTVGIAVLAVLLMLGIAGAGAHMIYAPQAGADDFCYGYAICQ